MSRQKGKPGVLIYLDIKDALNMLSDSQRGQLFSAILDYAADGVVPEFEDQLTGMAWAIIRPSIDRDFENYQATVTKRTYASYCRVEKEAGREPLPFAEWSECSSDDTNDHHMTSHDTKWYQMHPTEPNRTELNRTELKRTELKRTEQNQWSNEFDELWALYPRKDGKKDALRHYQRARKNGTTFEQVKAGILNYCEYLKKEKTEQRFIMMGSTWFNGEHWNDEYISTRQPTTMDLIGKVDLSDWGVT